MVTTGLLLPIVAGVIVELVTDVSVLGALWNATKAVGAFLAYPITLPLWGVALLSVSGLGLVWLWVTVMLSKSESDPDFMLYTSDILLGLKWRWHYQSGKQSAPIPFCPQCDYQPVLQEVYDHPQNRTEVRCDNCGFSKQFDFPPYEVQDKASRHVQRKLRTGEYKRALPTQDA